MAPSPWKPFDGQGVLRIAGSSLNAKLDSNLENSNLEKRQRSRLKLATINISTANKKKRSLSK